MESSVGLFGVIEYLVCYSALDLCAKIFFFFLTDFGFEVPDKFLVGYALDYNEYFRDLSVSCFMYLLDSDPIHRL